MAASLDCCCRPRLPLGGGTQFILGSNQIESDPRRFSAVLYEGQFVVLYFVGVQLLIPQLSRCIHEMNPLTRFA